MDKRKGPVVPPKVGEIVILTDEDQPSHKWSLVKVIEAKPDSDGKIRSISILSKGRVLRRAVNHAIPLEVREQPEQIVEKTDEKSITEQSEQETVENLTKTETVGEKRYPTRNRKRVDYKRLHEGLDLE